MLGGGGGRGVGGWGTRHRVLQAWSSFRNSTYFLSLSVFVPPIRYLFPDLSRQKRSLYGWRVWNEFPQWWTDLWPHPPGGQIKCLRNRMKFSFTAGLFVHGLGRVMKPSTVRWWTVCTGSKKHFDPASTLLVPVALVCVYVCVCACDMHVCVCMHAQT